MKAYNILARAFGGVLLECEEFDEVKAGKYISTEIGKVKVLRAFRTTQCFSSVPTSILLIEDVPGCENIHEFCFE